MGEHFGAERVDRGRGIAEGALPGRVVSAGGAGGLGDGVVAPGLCWGWGAVQGGVVGGAVEWGVLPGMRSGWFGGAGAAPNVFAPGRMVFGGRVVRWGRNGRGVVMLLAVVARSGGVGAPVRRGARVYVGFRRYERGSACLEGSRSGVIVPVCEERGERIMPGRGAAAPGMSAGSIVAGGVISAGGAGRGAVKWGCFAGNVEWADRRGGCCAGHFCAGRDDLGAGDASGLCWEWGAADRRAVFGGGHWPRGIDG